MTISYAAVAEWELLITSYKNVRRNISIWSFNKLLMNSIVRHDNILCSSCQVGIADHFLQDCQEKYQYLIL
jgi:hypothetical protein